MPASSKILDLRNLLAERFPQGPAAAQENRVPSGLPALDESTGGGLPKGAITELISPEVSAGSALVIYRLLETAHRERYFIALIDGRDSFDPAGFDGLPSSILRNVLWVRCRKTVEAVKAADLLLRDGNFPLVVLDLVLNAPEELRKVPQTSWYRLQRLVEPAPTVLLVLTRRSMIASAYLKLVLENRWRLQDLEAEKNFARLNFRVERVHGAHNHLLGTA
jgi:hypothetical protein